MRITKGATITGKMFGQILTDNYVMTPKAGIYAVALGTPTAGNFTLTFGGQVTTGIAYNAAAAVVQAALAALSSVGAGNVTVMAGAAGVYYVTFTGSLAGTASLLTGQRGGPDGGDVCGNRHWRGAGSAAGGLAEQAGHLRRNSVAGLTQLNEAFKAKFGYKGRQKSVETLDSRQSSFSFTVEDKFGFTAQLVMEQDAVANGYMNDLRTTTEKFCRIVASGKQIETGMNYKIVITFPFKFKADKRGEYRRVCGHV